MANNKTLELSIKIAGKMDKSLMATLNGSQSQISSFARSISSIGTAGLAAMATLATATVATIASCTKEAAKFENYMADVVKYVDGLADATGKISDKVADNGKTYAQNYEAMKDAIKDFTPSHAIRQLPENTPVMKLITPSKMVLTPLIALLMMDAMDGAAAVMVCRMTGTTVCVIGIRN